MILVESVPDLPKSTACQRCFVSLHVWQERPLGSPAFQCTGEGERIRLLIGVCSGPATLLRV